MDLSDFIKSPHFEEFLQYESHVEFEWRTIAINLRIDFRDYEDRDANPNPDDSHIKWMFCYCSLRRNSGHFVSKAFRDSGFQNHAMKLSHMLGLKPPKSCFMRLVYDSNGNKEIFDISARVTRVIDFLNEEEFGQLIFENRNFVNALLAKFVTYDVINDILITGRGNWYRENIFEILVDSEMNAFTFLFLLSKEGSSKSIKFGFDLFYKVYTKPICKPTNLKKRATFEVLSSRLSFHKNWNRQLHKRPFIEKKEDSEEDI